MPHFTVNDLMPEISEVWNRETEYILDITKGYHNLLQREEDGKVQSYVWDSEALFMEEEGQEYSYLNDLSGSVMRLSGNGRDSAASYRYDEFGRDLSGNQGQFQPFGYTGYRKDSVSGTYHAQAREYDAGSGRFTSEDVVKGSAAYPGTLNAYGYCLLNPLKYVDPTGQIYIVAWSYSRGDAEEFEKWYCKEYNIDTITIDGDTSDWDDKMWQEWDQRSSFARAANTKVNELIKQGVSADDIICERIDNDIDFTDKWKEWEGFDSV